MSEQSLKKPLFGKVVLKGKIVCITGMHIGTSREALEIGGLDSPVLNAWCELTHYQPSKSANAKLFRPC